MPPLPIERCGNIKLSTVVPYLLGVPPCKYALPRQFLRACLKISNLKQNLSKVACVWDPYHCMLEFWSRFQWIWREIRIISQLDLRFVSLRSKAFRVCIQPSYLLTHQVPLTLGKALSLSNCRWMFRGKSLSPKTKEISWEEQWVKTHKGRKCIPTIHSIYPP